MESNDVEFVQYDHGDLEQGDPVVRCNPNEVLSKCGELDKGKEVITYVYRVGVPSKVYAVTERDVLNKLYPDEHRPSATACVMYITVDAGKVDDGQPYRVKVNKHNFPCTDTVASFNKKQLIEKGDKSSIRDYIQNIVRAVLIIERLIDPYFGNGAEIDLYDLENWCRSNIDGYSDLDEGDYAGDVLSLIKVNEKDIGNDDETT